MRRLDEQHAEQLAVVHERRAQSGAPIRAELDDATLLHDERSQCLDVTDLWAAFGRDRVQQVFVVDEEHRRVFRTGQRTRLLEHAPNHQIQLDRLMDELDRVGNEGRVQETRRELTVQEVHVVAEPTEPLEVLLLVEHVHREPGREHDERDPRHLRIEPAAISDFGPEVVGRGRDEQADEDDQRNEEDLEAPAMDLRLGHSAVRCEVRHLLLVGDLVSETLDRGHGELRRAQPQPRVSIGGRPETLDLGSVGPVTLTNAPLEEDSLPAIAALCARSLTDAPTADELARTLFASDQPATVLGDPDRGVIASVDSVGNGHIRLLVVDPAHRGHGLGRELLALGEEHLRARGFSSVTVGADAPYYLWPGVETSEIEMLCLLERAKYARVETNLNLEVDLTALPADPGGWFVATGADRDAVDAWAAAGWENWRAELLRATDRGTLVLAHDDDGIAGVCAYDVNRAGWIGPVAVRPELIGRGVGVVPLLGALHQMRAKGRTRAEIGWVGPIVPYARVGARVGRVFVVCRKVLR